MYKTGDFDYHLPKSFIAQNPVFKRDESCLMIYDVFGDKVFHNKFCDLVKILNDDDVLVLNRSKVIPARILFDFDGKEVEIFLLKNLGAGKYNVMVRPGAIFCEGRVLEIYDDVKCEVLEIREDGTRVVKFGGCVEDVDRVVFDLGKAPFPPYIDHTDADFSQYQTIYAKEEGSVAAPTAGLHFTDELIGKLKRKGVGFVELLLHVGRGTFLPVKTEKIEDHVMHSEEFDFSKENAEFLNKARAEGRRIVAVGTTSVRVLESNFDPERGFCAGFGETDIFIYPGKYKWKAVDALITNFHLPKSTLLMLVSSFLEHKGVENPVKKLLDLYEIAKEENYRFYSFGDAMLIL